MTVYVLKMNSGEEVLGDITDQTSDDFLICDKPRVFHVMNTEQGVQASLAPYFISNPEARGVKINMSCIAAFFEASNELSKSYLSSTSGLILS